MVFEASGRIGGRAGTVWRDGFGFDVGAGALASTGTHVKRLMRSLNVTEEVENRGVVIGVPDGTTIHRVARRRPWTFLSFGALSTQSKLSLWRLGRDLARMSSRINDEDLSTAAELDTESVQDYLDRTYPREVGERLLGAFTRARFLVEPDQTSVVDLFAAIKTFLVADHLWTHPEGVGFFLDRAARRLDVRLSTRVEAVHEREADVEVIWSADDAAGSERFDGCVLAVTARDLLAIHPGLDSVRRDYLQQLEYSTCLVVNLGVALAPEESAGVMLIPREVCPDMPAVGLGHRLAPGRAPTGAGVLTGYWMSAWSQEHWDDSDTEIVDQTAATIRRIFPDWPLEVQAFDVARWESAMVASRPGTFLGLRIFALRSMRDRRIQVAGDFLAQTSVNASVAAGETMAARTLTAVRG